MILDSNNEMVKALNDAFESAKKHPGLMPVLHIERMVGSGKTSIIFAWLKKIKLLINLKHPQKQQITLMEQNQKNQI